MKYLIAGLGNIGDKYNNTRHNIGFSVLDKIASDNNLIFEDKRYALKAILKYKGRQFVLIKPTTFMNLSGKAIRYWLNKEKLQIDKLLVIVDDISLPLGTIRIRAKGGAAGHNGLENIIQVLGTNNFSRLRFGIGNNFPSGHQSEYVLSKWNDIEKKNC